MVTKVNGKPVQGIFGLEQEIVFVKLTFSSTIATTAHGVVDSVLDKALRVLAGKATILGVSALQTTDTEVHVMLGQAQGHYAAANDGIIFSALSITGKDNAGADITRTCTARFSVFAGLTNAAAANLVEFPTGQFRPKLDYPEVGA